MQVQTKRGIVLKIDLQCISTSLPRYLKNPILIKGHLLKYFVLLFD